jgi:peptide deformylase
MYELIKDPMKLKAVSQDVISAEEAKQLISILEESLKRMKNGAGLAAIQLGISKRVAIIRRNAGFGEGDYISIINPEIIDQEEEFIFKEGCLSFPDIFVQTKRFKHITIKNNVIDGDKFREEVQYYYYDNEAPEKIEAIALQHELDHFNGKIIIDNLPLSFANGSQKSFKDIGRNDPCPCGQVDEKGKPVKYKKCCGKILS